MVIERREETNSPFEQQFSPPQGSWMQQTESVSPPEQPPPIAKIGACPER